MKDFRSVSPSARSVILLKGHTDIPYARQAAEALSLPEPFAPDFANRDPLFWARVLHFEARYRGIDQLLAGLDPAGFLELSSGFNLRCLDLAGRTGKPYLDTDLPELIAEKARLVELLADRADASKVRLRALDALDGDDFEAAAAELPPGRIAIVTEGLLMYFDADEKRRLCANVRRVLAARGGWWVTSDIYLRAPAAAEAIKRDPRAQDFLDRHRVEENKFSSFDEARELFRRCGFAVDAEEDIDPTALGSYGRLAELLPADRQRPGGRGDSLRTTWRLTPAG